MSVAYDMIWDGSGGGWRGGGAGVEGYSGVVGFGKGAYVG